MEFQAGKIISLGPAASAGASMAQGINSQGEVTGWVQLPAAHGGYQQAFVYSAGRMHILGTLAGFRSSEGTAINDKGEVTGQVSYPTAVRRLDSDHAFFYSHGKMTDLGDLPGSSEIHARSINAAGQIVGECRRTGGGMLLSARLPFLCDSRRKTMTALLPTPSGSGWAAHINDRAQIGGWVNFGMTSHAALWSGGRLRNLGALPGDDASRAEGLNNRGVAVGSSIRLGGSSISKFIEKYAGRSHFWPRLWNRTTQTRRAVAYQNGEIQDLNKLISSSSDWILEDAHSINDQGQIVGEGLHHGQKRAFLLTPIS